MSKNDFKNFQDEADGKQNINLGNDGNTAQVSSDQMGKKGESNNKVI